MNKPKNKMLETNTKPIGLPLSTQAVQQEGHHEEQQQQHYQHEDPQEEHQHEEEEQQQEPPQRAKSRHKAPDDTGHPFDVGAANANATTQSTGSTMPPATAPVLAPAPPPRHRSKAAALGAPTLPLLYLVGGSLQQRQFANPISYLGGPRLQPRSNRNSIESILSLD